jgi:hypothetical protein
MSYVWNDGGFVNASFSIAGDPPLHAKMVPMLEADGLRRWRRFAALLTKKYRAPPMLDYLVLPELGYEVALFNSVPRDLSEVCTDRVLDVVKNLHGDEELFRCLAPEDGDISFEEYFERTYLDILRSDILETRQSTSTPSFITEADWEWMQAEVEAIAGLARGPAFQELARSAVHGDLWAGNVLAVGRHFFIVDWDDLAVGDPLKDYVDLTQGAGVNPPGARAVGTGERLAVWQRARLLVHVVDPLADWAEAGSAVKDPTAVRIAKRSTHDAAKRTYRGIYRG